jgi:pimeloyl-ACP methyl ester carboxylesterase
MPQALANGLTLEYETFGRAQAPAILLVMGLGGQLTLWPDSFCQALADAGYYVVRYDNRDIGLSSKIDAAGRPRLMRAGLAYTLGLPVKAGYTLDDMAQDAIGLLDALRIKRAHVIGASMGGMIAQILAAKYPRRINSLVSVMSSSGNPRLPGPAWKIRLRMVNRPNTLDRETLVRHSMQIWQLIGSPDYPLSEPEMRVRLQQSYERSSYPHGLARQTLAILASGSRLGLLAAIRAPTLIVHGAADRLVPVAAAHDLAKHIAGARIEIIPGMGHDLPEPLIPRLVASMLHHFASAERSRVHARTPSYVPVHAALPAANAA